MRALRSSLVLVGLSTATLALLPAAASAQYLGPSPYLRAADSPFNGLSFSYFYRETMEDGSFNTPGVTRSAGTALAPSGSTDSVDEDDGTIDGSGTGGHSLYFGNASSVSFFFDALALGGLPTHVGLVWTDVGNTLPGSPFGFGPVTWEAFDAASNSLGIFGPFTLGDGAITGATAEDRFFGVLHAGGISRVTMSMANSTDWEVDHLQYGRLAPTSVVPEPASSVLLLTGLVPLWRRYRRQA